MIYFGSVISVEKLGRVSAPQVSVSRPSERGYKKKLTEKGDWLWYQVHTCNDVYGLKNCGCLAWVTEHINAQEAPDKPV